MSGAAQQTVRKAAATPGVHTIILEHVDLGKCKMAMKEYNHQHEAPHNETVQFTAWANIIPIKDPSEYKQMIREFNEKRS